MWKSNETPLHVLSGILKKVAPANWDGLEFSTKVLRDMCSSMGFIAVNGAKRESLQIGLDDVLSVSDAVVLLRDDIQKYRSSYLGFDVSLHPDGKFDVKYDYNKPEGYEETDEVITGDEINQSLAGPDAAPSMSVEDAYRAIAYCVMDAQGSSGWDRGGVELEYKPGRQALMNFWQEQGNRRAKAPAVIRQRIPPSTIEGTRS